MRKHFEKKNEHFYYDMILLVGRFGNEERDVCLIRVLLPSSQYLQLSLTSSALPIHSSGGGFGDRVSSA